MNPSFAYVAYQQERMIPPLEDVEADREKRLVLLAPVGHAKSSIVTVNFIAWYMGKHPDRNVMLISYSDDFAKDFGRKIRNQLRHPLHQELFPQGKLAKDLYGASSFATISGGIFYAFGFDGAVFGKRADLCCIEDALKSAKDSHQHAVERVEFTRGVVKSRLKPGGRVIIATTRVCINDYVQRLLDNKEEGEIWTVVKIKAEPEPGKYLWPEYLGVGHYEEAKKHKKSWAAFYQQEPESAGGGPWFEDIPLPIYQGEVKPGVFPTYVIVDPALMKHSKADRTSIIVLAATDERKLLVVDWILDRMDPDERTKAIIKIVKKWKPKKLLYEEYGLNADGFHLTNEFKAEHISIRPIPVGRSGKRHMISKEDRIQQLIPDFREGRIQFPAKMERKLVDGETVDLVQYFREVEYDLYQGEDSTAFDEGLDCLSRIYDPEISIKYPEAPGSDWEDGKRKEKSVYVGNWAGSWESLY